GVTTALVMASAPALLTAGRQGHGVRAASIFQTAAGLGLAAGPLLGGLAVAAMGWRGVFWFRIPVALVLALVARQAVAADVARRPVTRSAVAGATSGQAHDPGESATAAPAVDRAEQLDPTARLAGSRSPAGEPPAETAPEPAWAGRRLPFVAANAATVLISAAMFVTWLLVPTFLVDHVALGAGAGGAVLALSPIATAVAARTAPALGRRRTPATVAGAGVTATAGGLAFLAATAPAASVVAVAVSLVLVGGGLGLFAVPNMATVMDALPARSQGLAGSLNLVMRTIGIVAGVAAASRLFDALSTDRQFVAAFQLTVAAGAAVGAVTLLTLGPARRLGHPTTAGRLRR
ncbi:MAG: MFS transporter, partial [Actinomycetota bacterium]